MIEALIAGGHSAKDTWSCTPKQLQAWAEFMAQRQKEEARFRLSVNALAAQGDQKSIRKQLKAWEDK